MKVSETTESMFRNLKGKRSETSDGSYDIRSFYPLAFRYYEGSRVVTMWMEPHVQDRWGSEYFPELLRMFVTRNSVEVWLECPVRWDNTDIRPETPDDVIRSRVEQALRTFGQPYVLHRGVPT